MAEEAKTIDEWQQKKQNVVDSVALLEYYVKNFDKEETRKEQVEAWAEKLERFYEDFHRMAVKIEALSSEENPIDLKGERQKFDSRYYALRAFFIKQKAKTTASSSSNPSQSAMSINIRLPEINLPTFSGRLEEWCVFRDSFESAVGSRCDIGPVEKLHYLKGLVQGEAARILDPIKVSEQGYKDAWRTLNLRFENKRQLIKCHIKTLLDTPAMHEESSEELLTLVDRFEQQISVLKSLGEPSDKWSSLLVYLLTIRLDPCTLREWENYCTRLDTDNIASVLGGIASTSSTDESTSMPSYVQMVNFLQNYSRVLHAVSSVTFDSPFHQNIKHPTSLPFATQASNPIPDSSSPSKPEKPCEMCGQSHHLYHCTQFQNLDVSHRTELVRQRNMCMNCLRSFSHFARTCSGTRCRVCTRKHHTLLHTDSSDTKSTPSTLVSADSTCCVALEQVNSSHSGMESSNTVPQYSSQQPPTSTASINRHFRVHDTSGNPQCALVSQSQTASPGTVFLPTALVNIRSSRGRIITARCLLDCASQRDYVSAKLCDKLQLPQVQLPLPITVSGIGNTTTLVEHEAKVTVFSQVSSISVDSSMLILPSITTKLPHCSVDVRQWSIPLHVNLADPTFTITSNVDMILGAAHFFHVLRDGRIPLGNGLPLLQNTEFGWVVSGEYSLENHENYSSCCINNPGTLGELTENAPLWSNGPPYLSELDHSRPSKHVSAKSIALENSDDCSIVLSLTEKVYHKMNLKFLHPQLANDDKVRLGGRLHHASIWIDENYPILSIKLLSTKRIVTREHHVDPGLPLSSLRQKLQTLGGRNLRQSVHRCIIPIHLKSPTLEQLLNQLPPMRVTQVHSFESISTDLKSALMLTKVFNASLRQRNRRRRKFARIYCDKQQIVRQKMALTQGTESPDKVPALAQGIEPPDEFPAPTRGNESPDEFLAHARGNRAVPDSSVKS